MSRFGVSRRNLGSLPPQTRSLAPLNSQSPIADSEFDTLKLRVSISKPADFPGEKIRFSSQVTRYVLRPQTVYMQR